jgi:hypothetical protein
MDAMSARDVIAREPRLTGILRDFFDVGTKNSTDHPAIVFSDGLPVNKKKIPMRDLEVTLRSTK